MPSGSPPSSRIPRTGTSLPLRPRKSLLRSRYSRDPLSLYFSYSPAPSSLPPHSLSLALPFISNSSHSLSETDCHDCVALPGIMATGLSTCTHSTLISGQSRISKILFLPHTAKGYESYSSYSTSISIIIIYTLLPYLYHHPHSHIYIIIYTLLPYLCYHLHSTSFLHHPYFHITQSNLF